MNKMKKFIGCKVVKAEPMKRDNYNFYRGFNYPDHENGNDDGYLVEYLDGGKPNHPDHEGYISWSPKEQFDNAYHDAGNLTDDEVSDILLSVQAAVIKVNAKPELR